MKRPNLPTWLSRRSFFSGTVASLALLIAAPSLLDAAGAAQQPNVCTRSCWNAQGASLAANMGALNRAVIHHTAGTYGNVSLEHSKDVIRGIQNYHMSNGWSDIGYHYLFDALGNVFEGRRDSHNKGTQRRGGHDSVNHNSFGYSVLGNYQSHLFTGATQQALWDTIAWRMPNGWSPYGAGGYGGKTVGYLAGHLNVKSTACPGTNIYAHIGTNYSGGNARNQINLRIQGLLRVAMDRTPNGGGYWIAAADGGVFSFGNASFYGSMGGVQLNSPIVDIAARPQGDGYWLAAADGGVFSFGAAPFHGSMGGQPLNQPIVGIASTASGTGYWLVAKDGGIFSFNAPFHGSLGGSGHTDIVAIENARNTNGYWILRSNGAIYSYNASYWGGASGHGQNDFVAMGSRDNGGGYWLLRSNGSIYTYGNMGYYGGASGAGFVGVVPGPSTHGGYWILSNDGAVFSFGDAQYHGGAN